VDAPGVVTVDVTQYGGGSDVENYQATMKGGASGFTVSRWIGAAPSLVGGNVNPPEQENPSSYRARLSARDHLNSKGIQLTSVIEVLRQDRANVHRYGQSDTDDQVDAFFGQSAARDAMENMTLSCADSNWQQRILQGTPLIEVVVNPGSLSVRILED